MISMYDNFSVFAVDAFNYLLNRPEIALPLIGVLILYFGYYSTIYKPIRAERLDLYLSGFGFLLAYIGVQLFIVYALSIYTPITPSKVVYWLSLWLLFTFIFYVLNRVQPKIYLRLVIIIAFLLFLYKTPPIIWNYFSGLENVKWIVSLLILYHATMVIQSAMAKDIINHNSYDYKDFYFGTTKMTLLQYSVFSYFLRVTQGFWYEIFFGKNKTSNDKKELPKKSEGESSDKNEFEMLLDKLKQVYTSRQLKGAGMNIQNSISQSETWFNSLLVLTLLYVTFTYNGISIAVGLILTIYLFFALTGIAIEYSICTSGFLLVELFLKVGEPFKCRLMRLDEKLIKILLKGDKVNPVEYYPLSEVSKIRCVSMGEMLDEF